MAIGYLSLKGMQKVFEQWAAADANIQGHFGYGHLFDINGNIKIDQKYPGCFVQPLSTTVIKNTVVRNYQIVFYDLVFETPNNENDIISDCEEYALRLNRFLINKSDIFYTVGSPTITNFHEKFLDGVAGVTMDVQIEFNGDLDDCNDPDYSFNIQQNNI